MFATLSAPKLVSSSKLFTARATSVAQGKSFLSSVRTFKPQNTAFNRRFCTETKKEQENEEEIEDTTELGKLKKDYKTAQEQIYNLKEEILRARADTENIRKIAHRDVENAKEFGIQSFAKSILDVNDNLKRAIESVKAYKAEENVPLHTLYEGVVMTKQNLVHALEKNKELLNLILLAHLLIPLSMKLFTEFLT